MTTEPRFVGREPELAVLARCLEAARRSQARVVVVEGEAGIGKTAFLRRCRTLADGFAVLEASAEETEITLDFGLVSQLVAAARGETDRDEPMEEPPRAGSRATALAVGAQLLDRLGVLQRRRPVLVAVDDVHWVDDASAAALLFAIRRVAGARLCWLLSTRPDAPKPDGPGWARILRDAEHATLAGLTTAEVSLLATALGHAPLDARAAERLRAHTRGHPLYLKTLLTELSPEVIAAEDVELPAPRSFRDTVLARLAGTGPGAQDLVAAVAAAGGHHPVSLVADVAGLDDPVAALDEALDADLLALVPGRVPPEVMCVHPLVRAAVYDDLALARRRALHLAWAARTPGPDSLAHRVAASLGPDDGLASELERAGEAAVAEGRLRAGIDLLLTGSRVAASLDRREAMLLRAANYVGVVGDARRSRALREEVVACRDSPLRSFVLAVMAASAGRLRDAMAGLRELTARPEYRRDRELAELVDSSLAIVSAYAGHGADAVAWARRVLDDAPSSPTASVTAKQALALGLALGGRCREGVAALGPVSAPAVDVPPLEVELLATRGNLKVWCGDLRDAVEDLSAVIRSATLGAAPRSLSTAYSGLAETEYELGRWPEAVAHAELALMLAEDGDQVWELPSAHAVAGLLHAARGDWAAASRHVDGAQRAARRAALPLNVGHARIAQANLALVRGDATAAVAAIEQLRRTVPDLTAAVLRRAWMTEAEALIRIGRLGEAGRVLAELAAATDERAPEAPAVHLWRLRGTLAHARRDDLEAREAFRSGHELAGRADSPPAAALLELAHGRALRRSGQRNVAIARLTAARDTFERLGARPFRQSCDDELAACGVRAGPLAVEPYGLSAREQVVARLVMAGKTNRQVGEELYLSTKAVEYHLANIYAKVGVRSRHDLPTRLTGLVA